MKSQFSIYLRLFFGNNFALYLPNNYPRENLAIIFFTNTIHWNLFNKFTNIIFILLYMDFYYKKYIITQ